MATAAALLIGCSVNYGILWGKWNSANVKRDDFQQAISVDASGVKMRSEDLKSQYEAAITEYLGVNKVAANLVSNDEDRLLWLELYKAIKTALPLDPPDARPAKLSQRQELYIEAIDCQEFDDLGVWYSGVASKFQKGKANQPGPADAVPSGDAVDNSGMDPAMDPSMAGGDVPEAGGDSAAGGPSGRGMVIQITGHHFYNDSNLAGKHVQDTLVAALRGEGEHGKVMLPTGPNGALEEISIPELGILFPVLAHENKLESLSIPIDDKNPPTTEQVLQCDFIVQFCWIKTPPSKRRENREAENCARSDSRE